MTEARWSRVKEVFHQALEHAPEERAAFLAETCGKDIDLREEVARLLDAHEAVVEANPENAAKFKDVLEFLKQDLNPGR